MMSHYRYPIGEFKLPELVIPEQKRLWLRDLAELPQQLRRLTAILSHEQLQTPYREGGWTLQQVVHHLADSHMNAYIRCKLALTEEQPIVKPYNETIWAELSDTREANIELSLQLIEALHHRWVILFDSLGEEQWQRAFYHPEAKRIIQLAEVLAQYSWHSRHHLGHISSTILRNHWLPYHHYFFDLDGTLTDPKEGIVKSIRYALHKLQLPDVADEVLHSFIGPPLQQSFREHFALSDEQVKEAIQYYREYYERQGMYENYVYPGVREWLQSLVEQGKHLYVATSKPTVFAKAILAHFDLEHYFVEIVGSELDGTRSDKAEIIRYLLDNHYDIQKDDVVMVGDRVYDLMGARENDIASLGVLYGYGGEDELVQARSTYILKDFTAVEFLRKVMK